MTGEIRHLLVAGFATRHVAASAARAGLMVYAVDHFCDQDLRDCTIECSRFDELAEIPGLIGTLCRKYPVDAIITTSGAEDLSDLPVPVLGTDPAITSRFLDKSRTQEFFEEGGWPVPTLAAPGSFPAMLKPCTGAGGWRNTIVSGEEEIRAWEAAFPGMPYLLQEVAPGIAASVCCVADGSRARALAANRQILRGTDEAAFGFCGSLTPLIHPMSRAMCRMAEDIAAASGCRGVIGIDFLLTSDRVFPIEVNPRFVATLDTVERAYGMNLVRIHLDACQGILPGQIPAPERVSIRKILFSEGERELRDDLSSLSPAVADIPVPPARFETGEAVISVFGEGKTEEEAREALDKTIRAVSLYMR